MTKNKALRMERDLELTETQAEAYALARHSFNLTVSRLQQSRVGKCAGPKYIKKDGFHIRYTPRFIDEYVFANKPRIIDPADRMAEAS